MDQLSGQVRGVTSHHKPEGDTVKESSTSLTITCHCGAHRQSLQLRLIESEGGMKPVIEFCDCESCRHISGTLVVSYLTVLRPRITDGLRCFDCVCANGPEASRRWFCAICGCHLFKQTYKTFGTSESTTDRIHQAFEGNECQWSVATGSIIDSPPESQVISATPTRSYANDGGLLNDLQGHCACGQLQLRVCQASQSDLEGDRAPWSPYADLLEPFARTPNSVLANPDNEKWWIRTASGRFRYLAGTCACRSCRLITGFEIQTWAFIPRKNIFICLNLPTGQEWHELDANQLGGGIGSGVSLVSQYESSRDVFRHFCSRCGATAFWRNLERPDLIDVSAGLFDPKGGGALAETHLEWWRKRVSFIEDSKNGRDGWIARWAQTITTNLQEGLGKEHESLMSLE
ncbi:hypothetical protein M406DRAFT_257947 [Cryphonectria parasitica EP155]|uniref:CENP-V/GFA domain-containing protein n=1 Tax=Cryphonectria parasitica (strain ATCC 38755 / EP155) TaxID=660469 RepID=A0A9P5CPL2_CRYP1|nr:uncharacterized protein M406DRAFT_257947 [Cryphonectria parasitica EP155]KAF3765291.1 hypothetical protein M406DRAFT_257947 [Cryphonectria parasitica EP155]